MVLMEQRRLYIGGLSDAVLEKDIEKKFSEFGVVKNVELRCKENYGNRRYFAYINIQADKSSLDNCVRACNNLEWRGGLLKVQPAKDNYLQTAQNDFSARITNTAESDTVKKSTTKSQAVKRKDSSDGSDDEPTSYLGVPKWRGFKVSEDTPLPSPSHAGDVRLQETATPGVCKRLYIGGLPESALDGDIKAKFATFGIVKSVEMKCKENFGSKRFFAYIDLDTDESRLQQCIRQCDNQSWRGSQLKVQLAKESFLQKAQNEIFDRKTHKAQQESSTTLADENGVTRTNHDQLPTDYTDFGGATNDHKVRAFEQGERGDNFKERRNRNEYRDSHLQSRSEPAPKKWDRLRHSDAPSGSHDHRRNHHSHSRTGGFPEQLDRDNTFESERNGLFDEIDAADEMGLEQDELLSEQEDEKHGREEDVNDPLSHENLKELFDQNSDSKGFALSSLFADQLTVEEASFTEDEGELPSRKFHGEVERFGDEYWRRAERVGQRSLQDMIHKHDRNAYSSGMSSSFFILPGDKRLEEGSAVFRTDEDPVQFVECWREQAEQLTLRLLQRKRNTRVQHQMAQRAAGTSKQASGKRKFSRKSNQGAAS